MKNLNKMPLLARPQSHGESNTRKLFSTLRAVLRVSALLLLLGTFVQQAAAQCTSPQNVNTSPVTPAYPFTQNGITVSFSVTGGNASNNTFSLTDACSTNPTNAYQAYSSSGSPLTVTGTYTFSSAVNNIRFVVTGFASNSTTLFNTFTADVPGQTTTLAVANPCNITRTGNTFKYNVPKAGGSYTISAPSSFTSFTITTSLVDVSNFMAVSLCKESVVPPCTTPTVLTNPTNQTICAGGTASFSASANNTPTTYQWLYNGIALVSGSNGSFSNENTANLTITPSGTFYNGGSFTLKSTNACGSVTSSGATLTINSAPSITTSASPSTSCVGGSLSFTGAASGTALSYKWQYSNDGFSWVDLTDGALAGVGTISGATTTNLGIANAVVGANKYVYRLVTSSNNACAVNDAPVSASVYSAPTVTAANSCLPATLTATSTSLTGRFYIKPTTSTSMVIRPVGGGTGNGTALEMNATQDANAQWDVLDMGGGNYKIINVASERAIDLPGGSTTNGTGFTLYDQNPSNNNQLFTLVAQNGGYAIKPVLGKCLDVNGGGINTSGARVEIFDCGGGPNQTFSFIPVTATYAWTGPSGYTGTGATATPAPTVAGTYSVITTQGPSCPSAAATTTITCATLPVSLTTFTARSASCATLLSACQKTHN